MPTLLALEHLHLAYDTARGLRTVIPDLNLELERGQIGCLLGASGCGKSTVLRAIAGFEPVRGGRIVLEGGCCPRRSNRSRQSCAAWA